MRRIVLFLSIVFLPFLALSQTPSKEELKEVSKHIDNLIKRDSINNLIIDELKQELSSLKDTSIRHVPVEVGKTITEKSASGDEESIWGFLFVAFGAGFLALLTPCVFPMIPMTVSFFTNTSRTRGQAVRKALIYGFCIVFVYSIFGVLASLKGPDFANWLSVHWLPNIVFFAIFIIFGLSFLGLFDINLPASFVTKVDREADKGGLYGVFFMALTLVVVSFSCTGPIFGPILLEASRTPGLKTVFAMLAYSLAFAIPFTLFALFPNLINKLPKSGGWLNVIKVTLGFVEIAFAFKFLSTADQVYHWNILDREIQIAIWIVLSFLLGYYLLGKLRLPHDTEIHMLSVPRLVFAMVPLTFMVYLIPGMFGAPLKMLSGFLPPMATHDFDLPGIIRENVISGKNDGLLCDEPKYNGRFKIPHGLKGYFDYEQAVACAKEKKIPVFIDFTGHACTNCRLIEANVWSEPEILKKLKGEFIIVSLYNDDKTPLSKEEIYTSSENRTIKNLGEKNLDLEITKFNSNIMPYYLILDPFDEQLLVKEGYGYNPSVTDFNNFLETGLKNFKGKKH